MYDINEAGDSELDHMTIALCMLKAYKMMYDTGIHLSEYQTIDLSYDEEDYIDSCSDLSSRFMNILTNKEVEVTVASIERGKILGYELYMDPDECYYYDYIVHQSDIDEYLKYWKRKAGWPDPTTIKNAYMYVNDAKLIDMIDNLICEGPNDWYNSHCAYLGNTFELVFLVTDDEYIRYNPDIMVKLMELVLYCNKQNEKIAEKEKKIKEQKEREIKNNRKKEAKVECLVS